MSVRNRRTVREDTPTSSLDAAAPGYDKDITFWHFLLSEYARVDQVLEGCDAVISFGQRLWSKRKRYQAALRYFKYGIPATVAVSGFVNRIRRFRRIKAGKDNPHQLQIARYRTMLGIKDNNADVLTFNFEFGNDVSLWMLKNLEVSSYKVTTILSAENLSAIDDAAGHRGQVFAGVEFEGSRFVWSFRVAATFEDKPIIYDSFLHTSKENSKKVSKLRKSVYREFVKHFDIEKNVMHYSSSGLKISARHEPLEKIRQVDMDVLVSEIKQVLRKGKKRGYGLIGIPGTGKSTVLRKLESMIKEYPIIYLSPSAINSPQAITSTFDTLRNMQPCIVIIEDLDSCDLRDKEYNLGTFLNEIDDVNGNLNLVLFASINDSSLVHYSLVDRRGRLDQIIIIRTPESVSEIYDVMSVRYMKNAKTDKSLPSKFMDFSEIDTKLLRELLDLKFTQSDICEIIEKCLLVGDAVDNELLAKSLDSLKKSKKALEECDFGGDAPSATNYTAPKVEAGSPQNAENVGSAYRY